MSRRAHGQIRRSQAVTTWGPGALLDLPRYAVIVGGLDTWPSDLDEVSEPRLAGKIRMMTDVAAPRLYAPPADSNDPGEPTRGIGVWRFPEWFVVQEQAGGEERERSRRLVHRKALDERSRFEGRQVVPTRFVRACPEGHVDDLDWRGFVHGVEDTCRRQLWLDERGTSGDLADLVVRCECGKSRSLYEATQLELYPLGTCSGARPWLGRHAREQCKLPSRLLIRTAKVAETLAPFADAEVLEAIRETKHGAGEERPVKQVELDALLAAPEGYGDDVPVDPNFHARRLPDHAWRRGASQIAAGVEGVIQLHRLREVLALTGFTRFEAVTPNIQGEYETDVERAVLALEPSWFPAVENRGEGLFLQLRGGAVADWLALPAVGARLDQLTAGHKQWAKDRKSKRDFPGGPYLLLHTLSHLLIQSLAMRCGYPASSIRERIYADADAGRFGILLYTGSPDAEGTLGGLVQQARHVEAHLAHALRMGALCSNDPICAQHTPGEESLESRWLHGAACHGCVLVAETSCEMRNDYLDRALVVPTLEASGVAFFGDAG